MFSSYCWWFLLTEGKALDLEAESEDIMEQWLAGLKFVLVSSGKGVVVNKQDDELPTPTPEGPFPT